jgi:hypothetical protein
MNTLDDTLKGWESLGVLTQMAEDVVDLKSRIGSLESLCDSLAEATRILKS